MIKMTVAQWKAAKVEFDLAIVWAQISALEGTLLNKESGVVPGEKTP